MNRFKQYITFLQKTKSSKSRHINRLPRQMLGLSGLRFVQKFLSRRFVQKCLGTLVLDLAHSQSKIQIWGQKEA